MMGWSPKCYLPSFVEIAPPVPEKKLLKVFTIYGRGGHLGHVTSIMSSNFHFLVPESFPTTFGSERQVVSEKFWFEVLFVLYTTLGQGQEMTLTFNTDIPS